MRVLVACECSGVVREAFRRRGHDAWSCDILPAADNSPYHFETDIFEVLYITENEWDLMIAHPPCTYLSVSGIHWNTRVPGRAALTLEAVEFVRRLMAAPIDRIAVENPVGVLSSYIRKPDQYVQPWEFGDPYSKKTGLWLKNLPKLVPTNVLTPTRFQTNGSPQWENQTPSGQNKLGPSEDRAHLRSITYPGLAEAMAEQWSR